MLRRSAADSVRLLQVLPAIVGAFERSPEGIPYLSADLLCLSSAHLTGRAVCTLEEIERALEVLRSPWVGALAEVPGPACTLQLPATTIGRRLRALADQFPGPTTDRDLSDCLVPTPDQSSLLLARYEHVRCHGPRRSCQQ